MKTFTKTTLILLLSNIGFSQCSNICGTNLLTNPDFETPTVSCSTADIQLYNSQTPVAGWYGTDDYPGAGSSPDYFSACAGFTNSANNSCISGAGRVGVFTKTSGTNSREYVQSQLITPLVAGKTYCFSMIVKSKVGSAGNLLSACDGMAAWFHNQGLINIQTMNAGNQLLGAGSLINANPQVENPSGNLIGAQCVMVTGTFCAQGGENWIVIGNFRNDASTTMTGSNTMNYMYIDDVNLFELCTPELELLASNDSINCGGSSVLTVNTTFPNGTTYNWTNPSGNSLSGLGPITISPVVSTTYTVLATYTNGCGIQTDSASINIHVGACDLSAVLNDTSICEGNCVNLQANGLQGGTQPYTIQWLDSNDNIISNTTGSFQVCPLSNSMYYLNVTDADGNTYSDSLFVSVSMYPVVNAGNDTSICLGNSVHLHGFASSGVDQWLTQGLGSDFQVFPLVSTHYFYQSNNNGCLSTDSIQITVNTLPQLTLSKTDISCFGLNNGTASATVNGNAPYTYNWSPTIGSGVLITGLSSGIEHLEVTDVNGCLVKDSILIQEPTQLLVTVSGNTDLCIGTSTTLSLNISGGKPNYSINWGNGLSTNNQYTIAPSSSTSISVTVSDSNNCQDSALVVINIHQKPQIDFIAGIKMCAGEDTLILNATSGATDYSWKVNGQIVDTAINLSFNWTIPDCYSIELIAENQFGCKDSLIKNCAVEIKAKPNSIVFPSKPIMTIDDPKAVLFNHSTDGDSCIWYLGNQFFHLGCETALSHTFTTMGDYTFSHYIYNDFGCVDSSKFTITVKEGLIYYVPNAFTPDGVGENNVFQPVFTSGFDPSNYNFEIYNRWGQLLFSSTDYKAGWDGKYDNALVQDGVYTWKINFKDLYTDKVYQVMGSVTKIN